ncbi:hypothetical protein [Ectobacillus funiculus]|uniref:Uncharacterized protein n=1 Tax=Ectobacillus funiculus TaxID=137993 RepID=A0ABV5WDX7_9BACI
MTIKMKMAQDKLILSGVQVPTITPVPSSSINCIGTRNKPYYSTTGERNARTETRARTNP